MFVLVLREGYVLAVNWLTDKRNGEERERERENIWPFFKSRLSSVGFTRSQALCCSYTDPKVIMVIVPLSSVVSLSSSLSFSCFLSNAG